MLINATCLKFLLIAFFVPPFRDWGVSNITVFSLLGSRSGLETVANVWPEGTEVFSGSVDDGLDDKGYVKPGVGDIGDRLFGTALS